MYISYNISSVRCYHERSNVVLKHVDQIGINLYLTYGAAWPPWMFKVQSYNDHVDSDLLKLSQKVPRHHFMINWNLFDSILSYFSHGLICFVILVSI